MNQTYLNDTTNIIDQNTSERMPSTFSGVSGIACLPVKAVWMAYSGLVPMSPYTTPIAASASVTRRPLPAPLV